MSQKEIPFGFGSSVKRFNKLGIHPDLIFINDTNPLGPGQYNPERPDCAYKKKAASWKKKQESEEFSKFLGFRNPQLLCDRNFDKTLGGPGNYDLFDSKPKIGASIFNNVGFGTEKRFHSPIKDETLPPGAHNVKKQRTKFTTTPTFEWDGVAPRFKTVEPSYRKAPNRYNLPHESILDKVVSKRGPYDTFTGPRDLTTIKNHFAPSHFKPPDTFYPIPGAMSYLLTHPKKKRCGKFLQEERFPDGVSILPSKNGFTMHQIDEEFPGPASYEVSVGIKAAKPALHPFNCSTVNARPPPSWKIHPGPDRYRIKYPGCHKKGTKGSWMFVSKAGREWVIVESFSNFSY